MLKDSLIKRPLVSNESSLIDAFLILRLTCEKTKEKIPQVDISDLYPQSALDQIRGLNLVFLCVI